MSLASERSTNASLLGPDDVAPVIHLPGRPDSRFVFCCDHAGARVPAALQELGLDRAALGCHIAIDIGIFATTSWLAGMLGAPLIAQPYSRLVIDCNRRPGTSGSIAMTSDARAIPGNAAVSPADRERRHDEILAPYQSALAALLVSHAADLGSAPVLMAMHSFTRRLAGQAERDCDIGVIFEGDNPFGQRLIEELSSASDLRIRHNEPYRIDFEGDYTLPVHSRGGAQPYVEIEICQDLIGTCEGQRVLAETMRLALVRASAQADPV